VVYVMALWGAPETSGPAHHRFVALAAPAREDLSYKLHFTMAVKLGGLCSY
jgi:hypothetical protein